MTTDRKQRPNKERSNQADSNEPERRTRERRSGEGSDSALANWKSIERDRKRLKPGNSGSSDR